MRGKLKILILWYKLGCVLNVPLSVKDVFHFSLSFQLSLVLSGVWPGQSQLGTSSRRWAHWTWTLYTPALPALHRTLIAHTVTIKVLCTTKNNTNLYIEPINCGRRFSDKQVCVNTICVKDQHLFWNDVTTSLHQSCLSVLIRNMIRIKKRSTSRRRVVTRQDHVRIEFLDWHWVRV